MKTVLYGILRRLYKVRTGPNTKLGFLAVRSLRKKTVKIGEDNILKCTFSYDKPDASITIGDRCYIGKSHLVAAEKIHIGNDVIISWGVTIVDHNSHSMRWNVRQRDVKLWHKGAKDWTDISIKPVVVHDRVWIGFGASILKGVTLGEGCVVGAGSVVTKDVLPYTVVAGNPAKLIRKISDADKAAS